MESVKSEVQEHWEQVYRNKPVNKVSWYQDMPEISLKLIHSVCSSKSQRILDVGSGASLLIPSLLDEGFQNVVVLDVSEVALEKAKELLGSEKSSRVLWLRQDVRDLDVKEPVFIWHDRAVLHFFTDPRDQRNYVNTLKQSLQRGGFFIVGTFAIGGVEQCSGLNTVQYDAKKMGELLGPEFALLHEEQEDHITPTSAVQPFWYGVFQYNAANT